MLELPTEYNKEEEFHFTPKPGNSNILIGARTNQSKQLTTTKTIEEGEGEQKKVKLSEKTTVLEEVVSTTKETSNAKVKEIEDFIAPKLEKALLPLYQVVDMISAESGKTIYYRYDESISQEKRRIPLTWNCKNEDEFYEKNERLGEDLLNAIQKRTISTTYKLKKNPVKQPDTDDEKEASKWLELTENKFQIIGANFTEEQEAFFDKYIKDGSLFPIENTPSWIWCLMDTIIFQFILSNTVYAALELASFELGFPLKDLVYSKEVRPIFAQYVARKFVSPKQNIQAWDLNGSKNIQYRLHSGFYTNQQDTKWLLGAKYIFANKVYYGTENQEKYDKFKANVEKLEKKFNELFEWAKNEFGPRNGKITYDELLDKIKDLYADSDDIDKLERMVKIKEILDRDKNFLSCLTTRVLKIKK